MLTATTVQSLEELEQIHQLNQQNLKQYLNARVQEEEGFVSWLYTTELLEKMHRLAPSIIVKDGGQGSGIRPHRAQGIQCFPFRPGEHVLQS